MGNAAWLYGRMVGNSLRGQMQYRVSFALETLSQFAVTAIEFLAIWALFDRFGSLRGWTLAEVAVFYGTVGVAFSFAEAVMQGFDHFPHMVRGGQFDRVLLRPRSTVLLMIGQQFRLSRMGRAIQAAVVLAWGLSAVEVDWSASRVLLLGMTFAAAVCFFNALLIFQATFAFWTVESLEVMSVLTHGGVETAQYPMSIYHHSLRRFLTFIVPLACVTYYPLLGVLGRAEDMDMTPLLPWIAPLAGPVFLLLALRSWRAGVRHYTSTGS